MDVFHFLVTNTCSEGSQIIAVIAICKRLLFVSEAGGDRNMHASGTASLHFRRSFDAEFGGTSRYIGCHIAIFSGLICKSFVL